MKRIYPLAFIFVLFTFMVACEDGETIFVDEEVISTTYQGSIHLNTQSQVEKFASKNHLRIEGNLTIGAYVAEETNISDISGLSTLTEITGTLYIYKNPDLQSLQGLENIVSVDRLSIQSNGVETIDAVANISTNTDLRIAGNPSLIELPTFTAITSVRTLDISGSGLLTNLSGIQNIVSAESVFIINNDGLTSLGDLSGIETVSNRFQIEGNSGLTDLGGLENLTSVGLLYIWENENLISLTGIESLSEVSRGISISENTSLTSLNHFLSLNKIGDNPNNSGIIINRNNALESLSGLEVITTFAGIVNINENTSLRDLCDLQNILNGTITNLSIQSNLHNPTFNDILNGTECSL